MKKALITGANKGIGLETARQLLQQGYHVYLGCRDLQRGEEAVAALRAEGLTEAEALPIDVSDEASVKAARAELGRRTDVLDVLINNAGISGGRPQTALGATMEQYHRVFEVNLFGTVRVTQAFVDLLRQSGAPRIVNVSSGQGSLTRASDPNDMYYASKGAVYQPSKAALNMYTIVLAHELQGTPFRVNAVDPGFTATDFTSHRGTGSVQDAAKRIVKYAVIGEDGPTGQFFSEEYDPVAGKTPW